MSLIIHAPNVHQGGGRALLLPLLQAAHDSPCTALVDARLELPAAMPPALSVVRVPPTLAGRLGAERALRRIARPGDVVLCFGNLPPLMRVPARVKLFVQNRYLLGRRTLDGLAWPVRLRIRLERGWLRLFRRDAQVVVQTPSMAREARAALGVDAEVMPFFSSRPNGEAERREFDFIYVASGEPHKNHRNLIEAWSLLAGEGCRPSLCLTLDARRDRALLAWIEAKARAERLAVVNAGERAPAGMARLYRQAGALIYPSLFESFGLPLLEAADAGLPIVAPERDYVREVVTPAQTFDPASPTSIARAVKRCLALPDPPAGVLAPADFLRRLQAAA